jgi:hypothetical protein
MNRVTVLVALSVLFSAARAQQLPASMSSLPVAVRSALLALCAPCQFADYDAAWNPTDVLTARPQRHLTRVVHTGSSWLIEYDHGGLGTHKHIVIFVLEPTIHIGAGSSCDSMSRRVCEW